MISARYKIAAVALPDGSALVVGGASELAEAYDANQGVFHLVAGASAALRHFPAATVLPDSSVLISGGYSGSGPQATVWRYRP